jgi:hypothetical protein
MAKHAQHLRKGQAAKDRRRVPVMDKQDERTQRMADEGGPRSSRGGSQRRLTNGGEACRPSRSCEICGGACSDEDDCLRDHDMDMEYWFSIPS